MYDSFPVFRGILDHWIYEDAEYLKVWVTMLAKAKYTYGTEKKVYMGIAYDISRGEFIFGRPTWVKDCKISEARLKLLMKRLVAADMIKIVQKYNRFTIYKVINYEKFNQRNDQQNDQQTDERNQGLQGFDNQQNNQQDDLQMTSEHPAKDQRTSNNKESKEVKQVKEDLYIQEIQTIFNHWVKVAGHIHSPKLTPALKKEIIGALKKYESAEVIVQAINNYVEVFNSDYYYSAPFTMSTFLKQSNCIPRFVEGVDEKYNGDIYKGYIHERPKQKPKQPTEARANAAAYSRIIEVGEDD